MEMNSLYSSPSTEQKGFNQELIPMLVKTLVRALGQLAKTEQNLEPVKKRATKTTEE